MTKLLVASILTAVLYFGYQTKSDVSVKSVETKEQVVLLFRGIFNAKEFPAYVDPIDQKSMSDCQKQADSWNAYTGPKPALGMWVCTTVQTPSDWKVQ